MRLLLHAYRVRRMSLSMQILGEQKLVTRRIFKARQKKNNPGHQWQHNDIQIGRPAYRLLVSGQPILLLFFFPFLGGRVLSSHHSSSVTALSIDALNWMWLGFGCGWPSTPNATLVTIHAHFEQQLAARADRNHSKGPADAAGRLGQSVPLSRLFRGTGRPVQGKTERNTMQANQKTQQHAA